MTTTTPDRYPVGRFEWERLIRRIVMPDRLKFLGLVLATYADADGTRVRPGERVLADVTGKSERTVRRLLGTLEDHYRVIELTTRGGGRGGQGRATEFRLTMPVDLLDRVDLLAPAEHLPAESPDTQVSGQSTPSPVDEPVDNPNRPDTQMSGESYPQPQNPVESPDTLMSPENDFHRTNNTVSDRLTGQNESIDRTPGCPPTKRPTTKSDQPPPALPTQLTTAREHHGKITSPPRQRHPHDRPRDAMDALLAFTPSVRRPPPSTPDGDP